MNDIQTQTPSAGANATPVDVSRFNRFINWCMYALVLLVPLIYLPFTTEVREFNKQSVLVLLVVVMLAVWVIKILTTRSVSWVKTSLDYIILAYLLIYTLASFLSIDKASSFLGYYGRFTGSLLSVVAMVVMYFIIVNNIRSEKQSNKIVNILLITGGIVMVYGLLQLLGVYVLPFAFAKARSFSTVGSMSALAIFSSIMLVFIQWAWMMRERVTKFRHIAYSVLTIVGLLVLFLINSFVGWLILSIGLIAFLALALVMNANSSTSATWFWRPLLILVVGILFVGFQFLPASINPRRAVSINLPIEIQLSNSANWNLVKNSLTSKPILGYGPGTTGIAFGDIKPESINKSIVWSLNFDRAASEIANVAIETGLLGLLAVEVTAVLFLIYALFFLLKRTEQAGRSYAFGFFLVWVMLYIVHFFYTFNTTFMFLYWLSLAMFMAIAHWKEGQSEAKNLSFNDSPRSALSWMFASLLVLAVLLVGGFFQLSLYMAETSYAAGIKELNKPQPDFAKAHSLFGAAVERNQYRDVYVLAYGQNLIYQASVEAAKKEPDVRKFQNLVSQLVRAGNLATNLSPNKASNWSARAQFYSQLRSLAIPGTDAAIIASWEEAIKLDSKNPALQVQLALAYTNASEAIDERIVGTGADTDGDGLSDTREQELGSKPNNSDSNENGVSDGDEVKSGFNPAGAGKLSASQLRNFMKIDENMLRKAEEALKKSIELKNDLPDSYIALARVYEKWNKLPEARQQLDEANKRFGNNTDVKYELGRITFNQGNFSEAEKIFGDVVRLTPNHANANFSLGKVYEQRGDRAKALVQYEKVREITGPNVDLERLINTLKTAQ